MVELPEVIPVIRKEKGARLFQHGQLFVEARQLTATVPIPGDRHRVSVKDELVVSTDGVTIVD